VVLVRGAVAELLRRGGEGGLDPSPLTEVGGRQTEVMCAGQGRGGDVLVHSLEVGPDTGTFLAGAILHDLVDHGVQDPLATVALVLSVADLRTDGRGKCPSARPRRSIGGARHQWRRGPCRVRRA